MTQETAKPKELKIVNRAAAEFRQSVSGIAAVKVEKLEEKRQGNQPSRLT
ncbi:MAG TPA: hypothetical protein VGB55_13550 [Tepidisphaeraceae bacterium]|jgi:hypothetical protein